MAYFDRPTNDSFRRDADGRRLYFPPARVGPVRLLPSENDEMAMRRAVKIFYRYGVLLVWPVFILGYFYVKTDGEVKIVEYGILALLASVLMLPAFGYLSWRSRGYQIVATKLPAARSDRGNDGASLVTTMVLTAFTVVIAMLAMMAAFGTVVDLFSK